MLEDYSRKLKQALAEIEALTLMNEDYKSLLQVTKAYPVAEVQGRATVGFIGQVSDGVSEAEWRMWAETEDAQPWNQSCHI